MIDDIFKPKPFRLLRRRIRFFLQRRARGWDDSETWNLDTTIAEFVLPRLKRFKEVTNGYPGTDEFPTPESWDVALDKMIRAFEIVLAGDIGLEEYPEFREGMDLFAKHYLQLWW